ncbi:hypothetical protein DNTS_004440 [Danionella cerebrum]|uniref:Uncharacterized protein n=1 Tax=Danionella cerebrum TaxID=2873325 RepID=A0A553R7A3_9TELE|nr:hypothetical protein DNTS_004440 [Danionella translucida]
MERNQRERGSASVIITSKSLCCSFGRLKPSVPPGFPRGSSRDSVEMRAVMMKSQHGFGGFRLFFIDGNGRWQLRRCGSRVALWTLMIEFNNKSLIPLVESEENISPRASTDSSEKSFFCSDVGLDPCLYYTAEPWSERRGIEAAIGFTPRDSAITPSTTTTNQSGGGPHPDLKSSCDHVTRRLPTSADLLLSPHWFFSFIKNKHFTLCTEGFRLDLCTAAAALGAKPILSRVLSVVVVVVVVVVVIGSTAVYRRVERVNEETLMSVVPPGRLRSCCIYPEQPPSAALCSSRPSGLVLSRSVRALQETKHGNLKKNYLRYLSHCYMLPLRMICMDGKMKPFRENICREPPLPGASDGRRTLELEQKLQDGSSLCWSSVTYRSRSDQLICSCSLIGFWECLYIWDEESVFVWCEEHWLQMFISSLMETWLLPDKYIYIPDDQPAWLEFNVWSEDQDSTEASGLAVEGMLLTPLDQNSIVSLSCKQELVMEKLLEIKSMLCIRRPGLVPCSSAELQHYNKHITEIEVRNGASPCEVLSEGTEGFSLQQLQKQKQMNLTITGRLQAVSAPSSISTSSIALSISERGY